MGIVQTAEGLQSDCCCCPTNCAGCANTIHVVLSGLLGACSIYNGVSVALTKTPDNNACEWLGETAFGGSHFLAGVIGCNDGVWIISVDSDCDNPGFAGVHIAGTMGRGTCPTLGTAANITGGCDLGLPGGSITTS